MWDRARASATAGLDRMHRRHLTGTAGGFSSTSTAGYNDRPGADRKHAGDAATPMSWTTISTSTSSSTFYQTNVDGPANALGIEIANTATAPQRPQRPQADAPSARVTSALHTGMYVSRNMADVLVFPSFCTWMYTQLVAMAASCTVLVLALCKASCAGTIPPAHAAASFANVYHLPSLPKPHTGRLLRAQPPADARQTRNDKRKNKAPCSSASGFLFCLQRIRLGRMMLFPRYLHCLPPLFTAL